MIMGTDGMVDVFDKHVEVFKEGQPLLQKLFRLDPFNAVYSVYKYIIFILFNLEE